MRKNIPKSIKDMVWHRQQGRCACCIEKGTEYHHAKPVALGGDNNPNNIILLCKEHHKLIHLGNLSAIMQVLEYVYFLKNRDLPNDYHQIESLAIEISNNSNY